MSVVENELYLYGSANMPDVNGATTGGALNTAILPLFTDLAVSGTVDYVSSASGDTAATLQSYGYDVSGVVKNETATLSGTTKVAGTQVYANLLKGIAAGTTAVGELAVLSHTAIVSGTAQGGGAAAGSVASYITLASGQGASCAIDNVLQITNNLPVGAQYQLRRIIRLSGDTAYINRAWGTIPTSATTYSVNTGMLFDLLPNQVTQVRRTFYNVAADAPGGSNFTYYEKIFAVNNDTSTTLTVAAISKQIDPSAGTLEFALTNALNDTATVANRNTAPASGITAFTVGAAPQAINVPAPQNLPAGAAPNASGAQGIWLSLALASGTAATKTAYQMQTQGQST